VKKTTIITIIVVIGLIIFSFIDLNKIDPTTQTAESTNSSIIAGQDIPMPTGYVIDNANLLDTQKASLLTDKLKLFADSGHGELAVLTVNSMNGLSIEEYGIRVAEKWKVGTNTKDDGIILIIALQERKVRIEVGREAAITDAQANTILTDIMVPKLKTSDWAGAIEDGTTAIINQISK